MEARNTCCQTTKSVKFELDELPFLTELTRAIEQLKNGTLAGIDGTHQKSGNMR